MRNKKKAGLVVVVLLLAVSLFAQDISIYSTTGQSILTTNVSAGKPMVNICNLMSGIYVVMAKANDKIQTVRLVKQ